MIPYLFYYQLVILGLLWLCVMMHYGWPGRCAVSPPRSAEPEPIKPKRKRSNEPTAFAGLTYKPHCPLCEQASAHATPLLPVRPPPMLPTNRRPREIDTSMHFCPHVGCDYRGWLGLGNLRANGHPRGGPWRQFQCTSCGGSFLETHGTIFHGKRLAVELMVRVLACLAEGLGIRATARVFEVDPNTVLQWLVEVMDQLQAFSRYFLGDVHVRQVQLDELYAVLSAVKDGELSEDEAIKRLARSPQWVWVVLDPVSKLLLAIDVGQRTLAMAQSVVHQVVRVLALGCVPLFLTDGFKEYTTALLTHYGQWVQPARQQAHGPTPKPRWLPLPALLYAQVVKTVRRRRLVRMCHRVVCGTIEAVQQVLAAHGWQINTAFIEVRPVGRKEAKASG
jgi:hypothetical protein